ncbi:MAG: HAD family hydrolase [Candidatus Dormibacterales bacterium]
MTTAAVTFDYGLTLVGFKFPRSELLAALETFRPEIADELGRPAPEPAQIMAGVLEPLERDLAAFGEDEVADYLEFYERGWSRAGLDLSRDLLFRILDAEQRCWDQAVRVAPGALRTLDRLRGLGLRTAVASNAPFPPAMMRRQMEGTGIAARVDAVVLSSEVGRRKPAPEVYLAALAALHTPARQALHVGDRLLEDFRGPTAVGMRAVLCTALAEEPAPPGVPSIARLEEVEAVL